MILVSACLAGINAKFNRESNHNQEVIDLIKEAKAIPVCPEQLGGLATPREAVEIKNGHAVTKNGTDVTSKFRKGAEEVLKIAKMCGVKKAILKSRSPSCGKGEIYDGSFTKTLCSGSGLTAELLEKNGIEVISMDNDE